jgi:hypothetical protein
MIYNLHETKKLQRASSGKADGNHSDVHHQELPNTCNQPLYIIEEWTR